MYASPVAANNVDIGGTVLDLGYDSLDSALFPTRGQSAHIRWQADRESLGASIDADLLSASWQAAWNRGRYSLLLGVEGGSALDDQLNSRQDQFTLGGFLELSGLPRDALTGTQYGLARAIVFRRVSRGGTGLFEMKPRLVREDTDQWQPLVGWIAQRPAVAVELPTVQGSAAAASVTPPAFIASHIPTMGAPLQVAM